MRPTASNRRYRWTHVKKNGAKSLIYLYNPNPFCFDLDKCTRAEKFNFTNDWEIFKCRRPTLKTKDSCADARSFRFIGSCKTRNHVKWQSIHAISETMTVIRLLLVRAITTRLAIRHALPCPTPTSIVICHGDSKHSFRDWREGFLQSFYPLLKFFLNRRLVEGFLDFSFRSN